MARDRSRTKARARKENVRDERPVASKSPLLNFNFKYLDESQPKGSCETIELWEEKKLISALIVRLKELSALTVEEAINQHQLKIYGDFPSAATKTAFVHPKHVESNVEWGVVLGIAGVPRVAGFISNSTFYVVFLDSQHRFWPSELKHT